jgi:hypothetical protein
MVCAPGQPMLVVVDEDELEQRPEILRKQLDIPDELTVLCGLAIGYPDPAFGGNSLVVPRNPVETNVVFCG